MGRTTFTPAEIEELRQLVREKQTADPTRQKLLRSRMRRLGFYISDYGDFRGFTISDFDVLLERGTITSDADRTRGAASPLPRALRPVYPSTPAAGAVALRERRRSATDAEVAAARYALDERPQRMPASQWPGELMDIDACGMYAWWVDQDGADDLSQGLIVADVPAGRIYAGLTGATKWPSGKTGTATLRIRVGGNHINGRVRGSTFRLTLAAALRTPLDLQPIAPRQFDAASEARLSAWIRAHLEVAVHPFPHADALADLEHRLLVEFDPPFNLDGMARTPLRTRLTELRRGLSG